MQLVLKNNLKKVRADKVRFTTICAIFIAAFFIMFRYLFDAYTYPILFSVIALLMMRRVTHFKLDESDYFWIIYALIMVTFGLIRDDQSLAVKRFLLLVTMIALKIILQSDYQKWRDILYRLLIIFGLIHAFGIFLDIVNPTFTKSLRLMFTTEHYDYFENYRSAVYRFGFTNQPGVVGFCLTCLCSVCAVRFFQPGARNRAIYLVLLLIGISSLLLTGKRALFAEALFAFFVIAFLYNSLIMQKGTKFFIGGFIVIAIFAVIASQPVFSANVDRLLNGDDAGRAEIWEFLINNFKSSPIIGVGKDVFTSQMDMGAHNEYLKVLSENGILGFVFFIIALAIPLIKIIVTIIMNRQLLRSLIETDQKDIVYDLLASVSFQIIILLYSLTGNPLTSPEQTTAYFIFTAIGIGAMRRLQLVAKSKRSHASPSPRLELEQSEGAKLLPSPQPKYLSNQLYLVEGNGTTGH